jgi:ABC-type bacteriocin/lantibiotic exporter with double-glycine peptidase domain
MVSINRTIQIHIKYRQTLYMAKLSDSEWLQASQAAMTRLWYLLGLEKQGLAVVLVYAMGTGVASLAAPIGVQLLVGSIAFGGLGQPIAMLGLMVFVALLFAAALQSAQAWVVERIQQRLFVRVAQDLTERLSQVSTTVLDAARGPELVNRFFEVFSLQKGAAMLLLDGIFIALQMLVGGLLLAFYHPMLLGLGVLILLALLGIVFGLGADGPITSLKESKIKFAVVAWFEDFARHNLVFHGDGKHYAAQRSQDLVAQYIAARQKHYRILFAQTVAFLSLQAIATTALLVVGGYLVLKGQLTLGQLVAAELILTSLVYGFAKFGKYVEVYYELLAASDKLGSLVSLPLERDSGENLHSTSLHLRLLDPEGRVAIDAPAGSRVAVVGANASGKSTLIDLFFGLRDPLAGRVEVNGLPLSGLSLKDLRHRIALVRGAALFDGSVLENIRMGRNHISLEDVRWALETVDLWQDLSALPDGLETEINSHLAYDGGSLSAGQAQRLAIARAIVARPQCLLLDEALDDLDPQGRTLLLSRILGEGLGEGLLWTVIVTTHDPNVAAACPEQFVLQRSFLKPFFGGSV